MGEGLINQQAQAEAKNTKGNHEINAYQLDAYNSMQLP